MNFTTGHVNVVDTLPGTRFRARTAKLYEHEGDTLEIPDVAVPPNVMPRCPA